MKSLASSVLSLTALVAVATLPTPASADRTLEELSDWVVTLPCCEMDSIPGVVWWGTDSTLTLENLAAYCAPILWFSPDEPLLDDGSGLEIVIPEPFPFEEPGGPITYFRVRRVLTVGDPEGVIERTGGDKSDWTIDLSRTVGLDLDFFFYYSREEGLNAHRHDVESVQMRIAVTRREDCPECPYGIAVLEVLGKAHGVLWYDNTLTIDRYAKFPMHVMVEEAKHASCPDKNGDGAFTPGYDVNQRINDAWGIRDIIRSGGLFSSGFESWMAKARRTEHRVFPPLPEDSPLREGVAPDGPYADGYSVYELRPFPGAERAEPELVHFIADKGDPDWPEASEVTTLNEVSSWFAGEELGNSFGFALRGANSTIGVTAIFPLFLVKNFQEPIGHGYIMNRIYFQDTGLRDFGWNLLYTKSASRWLDGYFSAGVEYDVEDVPGGGTDSRTDFVSEAGLKFRVNMNHSPLKFLARLGTDFWGFRAGLQYRQLWDIDRIGYVFEFGAGSF